MPRTLGTTNIKPWEIEQILRAMALGASHAELSDEFGYQEQSLRVLKMNHKHEIAVLLAVATAKLDHIWSTKVENDVRVLTERWEQVWHQIDLLHEHARRETELSETLIRTLLRCRSMIEFSIDIPSLN